MDFIVLGLPRSRTAWLANFLTYDDLFCYHEGTNGCETLEQYKEKTEGKGDSNTGLVFFDVNKHFPDAKLVIIDADVNKSIAFGIEKYNVDLTDAMIKLKERLDALDGLHININEINEHLEDIWNYVTDKPFNKERADMLIKMNIQVNDLFDIDMEALKRFKESVQ